MCDRRRITALFLMSVLFLSLFFALFEPPHDCEGEECTFCIFYAELREGQDTCLLCTSVTLALSLLRYGVLMLRAFLPAIVHATPITLKVKLSD